MFLHPLRANVLSALALAAGGRESLPAALERLAASDPLLKPWVARLVPALRVGAPLGTTLRRARLIDRIHGERLDAAADPARALDRLARQAMAPIRGAALVVWLPVWLALALVVPMILPDLLMRHVTGSNFEALYRELGLILPDLTEMVMSLSRAPWSPLVLALGIAGAMWLLAQFRGLRHVLHLWNPEVHRNLALLELLRCSRDGGGLRPARPSWFMRCLMAVEIGARRPDRPEWDLPWRTWLFLTRFRLRRGERLGLASLPTITERLTAIGVLTMAEGVPDHDTAEERLRSQLQTTLDRSRPWLLFLSIGFALSTTVMSYVLPFFKIIEYLGCGGM